MCGWRFRSIRLAERERSREIRDESRSTKKTMASAPSWGEAMGVGDSYVVRRMPIHSIRFNGSLERGDPIDQVGRIRGSPQVRVLRQRRRTRLIRIDPDDGEQTVHLAGCRLGKKTRPDQRCQILLPKLGLCQFCRHGAPLQQEKKEAIRKLFEVRFAILPEPSAKPSILESGNQHLI